MSTADERPPLGTRVATSSGKAGELVDGDVRKVAGVWRWQHKVRLDSGRVVWATVVHRLTA